jgi:hypothetical protein
MYNKGGIKLKKIWFLVIFIFLLGACEKEKIPTEILTGSYTYQECVYLSPFSSSTLDYMTSLHEGDDAVQFHDDSVTYKDTLGHTFTFQQISYQKEDIYYEIDPVIHDGISSLFASFESRFDMYDHDQYTGLTFYLIDDSIYLAEISVIGASSSSYLVTSIYKLN